MGAPMRAPIKHHASTFVPRLAVAHINATHIPYTHTDMHIDMSRQLSHPVTAVILPKLTGWDAIVYTTTKF